MRLDLTSAISGLLSRVWADRTRRAAAAPQSPPTMGSVRRAETLLETWTLGEPRHVTRRLGGAIPVHRPQNGLSQGFAAPRPQSSDEVWKLLFLLAAPSLTYEEKKHGHKPRNAGNRGLVQDARRSGGRGHGGRAAHGRTPRRRPRRWWRGCRCGRTLVAVHRSSDEQEEAAEDVLDAASEAVSVE